MINFSERDGVLTFKVHVVPRASRSEIVGEHNGALRVRIAAPPLEGAANTELVKVLAKALGVSRTTVEIKAGHRSKLKDVIVRGGSPAVLAALGELDREQR